VKELVKEDITLPKSYCKSQLGFGKKDFVLHKLCVFPVHVYGQKNKSQGHKEVIFEIRDVSKDQLPAPFTTA